MKLSGTLFNKYVQRYESHVEVFREGDPGDRMFIIAAGELEIRKKTGSQTFKTLVKLKKGDFFGEMAMVERKPRSASAFSLTECQLLVLDRTAFYNLVQQSPEFAMRMMKVLSARLRNANYLIEQILINDTDKMIFKSIGDYLSEKFGITVVSGAYVDTKDFSRWITSHLGYQPEAVVESMKSLIRRNLIHPVTGDNSQFTVDIKAIRSLRY